MNSMTQALKDWKPGDGPLPGKLDQVALLVYSGPAWMWADPGAYAQSQRDEARAKVIAVIERFQLDQWSVTEAEPSLAEAFAVIQVGDRAISPEFRQKLTSYANECLETLVTDREFRQLADQTVKQGAA